MNDVHMLVVHSQPLVVAGINSFLVRMPHWRIVASVPDARSAIRFLRRHAVNVMLTDYHLAGLSGIALCGIVRNFFPTLQKCNDFVPSPLQQLDLHRNSRVGFAVTWQPLLRLQRARAYAMTKLVC